MILLLVGLSTFSIGLSHATSCHSLQQSQLASLNERMNQMINALYPSPFSKAKASAVSYQSTTPTPPSEYSTAASYDSSCYQGYQQMNPHVVYMSQPHSPTTVAISPPAPGSPPTVTISTTRVPSPPCYSYDGQEYYPEAPKPYPPHYYEYAYTAQYPPPPPYTPPPPPYTPPPPQYAPPAECPCQQQTEYPPQAPCPQRQAYLPPAPSQPEYTQGCPPPPPCSPPPPYTTGPTVSYSPSNYSPPSPYAPPSGYSSPAYPTGFYAPPPPPSCPPPPPYPTYGSPAYPQSSQQYPPAPTYTNPRDLMQPPQY